MDIAAVFIYGLSFTLINSLLCGLIYFLFAEIDEKYPVTKVKHAFWVLSALFTGPIGTVGLLLFGLGTLVVFLQENWEKDIN